MYKRSPLEKRLRRKGKGKTWYFWGYNYLGKRYETTTHQTDWKAALNAAREIERERAGAPVAVPKKTEPGTLAQAFECLTAHEKRVAARPNTVEFHDDRKAHLLRLLGEKTLCDSLTVHALNQYTDKRLEEGAGRHTIQKEHRVLRQALRLSKVAGLSTIDQSALKVEGFINKREFYKRGAVWLEKAEYVVALLAEVVSARRDDVTMCVNTGLRRRELLTIARERVNLGTRILRIDEYQDVTLKTEASVRKLPLNESAYEVLHRRLEGVPAGVPVFSEWASGNRDLQAAWERAREKLVAANADLDAELPTSMTFNALRHTFCSLMKNEGVSADDCADLLGHEDRTMVIQVYGHAALSTLRKAVNKLPRMICPASENAQPSNPPAM